MTGDTCQECGRPGATGSGPGPRCVCAASAGWAATTERPGARDDWPAEAAAWHADREARRAAEIAAAEDFDPLRIRPYVTLDSEGAEFPPPGGAAPLAAGSSPPVSGGGTGAGPFGHRGHRAVDDEPTAPLPPVRGDGEDGIRGAADRWAPSGSGRARDEDGAADSWSYGHGAPGDAARAGGIPRPHGRTGGPAPLPPLHAGGGADAWSPSGSGPGQPENARDASGAAPWAPYGHDPAAPGADPHTPAGPGGELPPLLGPAGPGTGAEPRPRARRRGAGIVAAAAALAVAGTAAYASGLFAGEGERDRVSMPDRENGGGPSLNLGPDAPSAPASPTGSPSGSPAPSRSGSPSPSASASPTASPSASATRSVPVSSAPAAPSPSSTASASGSVSDGDVPETGGGDGAEEPPPPGFAPASLSRGDTGPEVRDLQKRLQQLWLYSREERADGIFDQGVEDAVKVYQWHRGIQSDPLGVYGPETRRALESETRRP
ncbi:peptidoglycan-binding protein [Streptomyces sp. NPDC005805]|uniref:peptidoglycan-binding protein n=1 Tax=Streptomyces sp. NPDC005805 TaxID=3157068 RepID=UPI0034022CF9